MFFGVFFPGRCRWVGIRAPPSELEKAARSVFREEVETGVNGCFQASGTHRPDRPGVPSAYDEVPVRRAQVRQGRNQSAADCGQPAAADSRSQPWWRLRPGAASGVSGLEKVSRIKGAALRAAEESFRGENSSGRVRAGNCEDDSGFE